MRLMLFFFSSRRRHTRYWRDWSSDVCSSDLRTKIENSFVKESIFDEETGEIIAEEDAVISEALISKMIEHKVPVISYWEVKPEDILIANTIANDTTKNSDEAVTEVFRKLRPGDLVTVDSARSLIKQMFFNVQRYDLEPVGRYKMTKRLKLEIDENEVLLTPEDVLGTIQYVIDLKIGR